MSDSPRQYDAQAIGWHGEREGTMGAGTPWWYRMPTKPLGIIVTCVIAIAIILSTPDITTVGIVGAVLAGGCGGFLVQFIQGVAQARHDERTR